MKKLLPLIMTLFFALSLNAQVGVNVGPKIGYQASKLSFKKTDIKTSFNNDLNLGVFTRFTFKKFILQPELLYSFQNASHKVNNLSVPVLVGLKLVDQKNFKMRANVGPVAYFTVGNSNYSALKKINWGGALGLAFCYYWCTKIKNQTIMKEKTKIILRIIFRAINEILRYIITGKQ